MQRLERHCSSMLTQHIQYPLMPMHSRHSNVRLALQGGVAGWPGGESL